MYEVRIHGRGGQGAVSAAQHAGDRMLDGQVRRLHSRPSASSAAAPVVSFIRASEQPIRQLTNIYAPGLHRLRRSRARPHQNIFAGLSPAAPWCRRPRPLAEIDVPDSVGNRRPVRRGAHRHRDLRPPDHQHLMLGAFAPQHRPGLARGAAARWIGNPISATPACGRTDASSAATTTQYTPRTEDHSMSERHQHYRPGTSKGGQGFPTTCPVATEQSPMLPGDWRMLPPGVDRDKCVKVRGVLALLSGAVRRGIPAWFDFNLKTCRAAAFARTNARSGRSHDSGGHAQ